MFSRWEEPDWMSQTYSFANRVIFHEIHGLHFHLLEQFARVVQSELVLVKLASRISILNDFIEQGDAVVEVVLVARQQVAVLLCHFYQAFYFSNSIINLVEND